MSDFTIITEARRATILAELGAQGLKVLPDQVLRLGGGGGLRAFGPSTLTLPFTDDFGRADGAIGNGWTAGAGWTIASGKAVNSPTLGSELYGQPGFAADDTSWTKGTGWSIGGGVATGASASGNIYQDLRMIVGRWYAQGFTIVTVTAGGLSGHDGTAAINPAASTTGAKLWTLRARNTTSYIADRVAPFIGTIDDATLKQLTLNTLFAARDVLTSDVTAQVTAAVLAGTQAGVVVNLDSAATPANFVLAYHDGVKAYLVKCVAGTYTEVVSGTITYGATKAIKVIKLGTTYKLLYDAIQIGADKTISDAGIVSNTLHGLFSTYSGNTLEDFSLSASPL